MKNIKNIVFATLITFFAVSCKKQATTEVKEVATTKTEAFRHRGDGPIRHRYFGGGQAHSAGSRQARHHCGPSRAG